MRVGAVSYATEQGLGRLMKSFYDAGVVTDVMIYRHPHGDRPTHTEWYPPGTIQLDRKPFAGEAVERWLDDLDVVLFFETPHDWGFVGRCRERGVRTAIVPMYEWTLRNPPHKFDVTINPSLLDQQYFPYGTFLPIPPPSGTWRRRDRALKFLHNAGHVGCRGHKGTLELLRAMRYVDSSVELTVRCQDKAALVRLMVEAGAGRDLRIKCCPREIPYEDLFADHDVYVAPEKFNGLSLPLQEAFAAGMMVMTTDRFPANTWLPTCDDRTGMRTLIQVEAVQRATTSRGHLEFDESIVSPQRIAERIDDWYGQDISDLSLAGRRWAEENSWERLRPRWVEALGGKK